MVLAYLLLVCLMVAAALVAVRARGLITSALALCLGSSCLAALFFLFDAPYAGAVQLSVGAGLLSILFIVAVGLTESMRGGTSEE